MQGKDSKHLQKENNHNHKVYGINAYAPKNWFHQRWSVGLFTLPHNFKTILDESWEEEALVEEREKSWDEKIFEEEGENFGKSVEQGGIKVICVGLSRCNTKQLLHLNCTFMKKTMIGLSLSSWTFYFLSMQIWRSQELKYSIFSVALGRELQVWKPP